TGRSAQRNKPIHIRHPMAKSPYRTSSEKIHTYDINGKAQRKLDPWVHDPWNMYPPPRHMKNKNKGKWEANKKVPKEFFHFSFAGRMMSMAGIQYTVSESFNA